MVERSSFSARFAAPVTGRLRERAKRGGQSQRHLAERYIDEGLRMDDHPGIAFRDEPAGRRAGLAAGPDVWELVAALKRHSTRGQEAVRELAGLLELSDGQIETALDYYGEYPEEIEELIGRHEEEAERAEATWLRQQSALD